MLLDPHQGSQLNVASKLHQGIYIYIILKYNTYVYTLDNLT